MVQKRLELGNLIRVPYVYRIINKRKYIVFQPLDKFWQDIIDNNIIYKDKDILVINKPSGVAVQGGQKLKII